MLSLISGLKWVFNRVMLFRRRSVTITETAFRGLPHFPNSEFVIHFRTRSWTGYSTMRCYQGLKHWFKNAFTFTLSNLHELKVEYIHDRIYKKIIKLNFNETPLFASGEPVFYT